MIEAIQAKSGSFVIPMENAYAKGDLRLKEGVGVGVSSLIEKGENPAIFIHFSNEICMEVVELDHCLDLACPAVRRSIILMEEVIEFRKHVGEAKEMFDWICASLVSKKGDVCIRMDPSATGDRSDQVEVVLRLYHIHGGFCTTAYVPFTKLAPFLELKEEDEELAEACSSW